MTERQTSPHDRTRVSPQHSKDAAARATAHTDGGHPHPAADPLAALERARRLAYEAQEAERWDGLA